MALETPSRPPPFMANAILNFHFDYLTTSLTTSQKLPLTCANQTLKTQGTTMKSVLFKQHYKRNGYFET